jgi:hypothetical protein
VPSFGVLRKKKTFGTPKFGVKLWNVEQKKKSLKSNDLILVTIFMALNYGAQRKKKPFIAPKFSAKLWSAKNFTLHSLVLNFGTLKEKNLMTLQSLARNFGALRAKSSWPSQAWQQAMEVESFWLLKLQVEAWC